MHETQDDEVKSKLKLAQFVHFFRTNYIDVKATDWHHAVVNNILQDKFDVNCRFTTPPVYESLTQSLKDTTTLHFVFYKARDIDIFNTMLERGADFTAKNGNGNSVLHSAIIHNNDDGVPTEAIPFIESVLSAHVKHKNVTNPQNDEGLSHLHGACIVNHVDSLNWFLDTDGTLINQVTDSDCQLFSAFTPLHFAVLNDSFEAAQILVNRGADFNAKNGSGMTPLDDCLKRRLKLFRISSELFGNKEKKSYQYKLCQNEKIVKLLLHSECVSAVGLSKLHVASTLKDLSIAEQLLSQDDVDIGDAVPMESSIYPGYTAAHFAALNSIDAVKILLRRGAKMETQNAQGYSVLDLCVEEYSSQDVHDMLASFQAWKSLRLSDGRTTLLDILQAVANVDQFKLFLQNVAEDTIVPRDSLLWQGCTILHLAVIFAKKTKKTDMEDQITYGSKVVEECLKVGHSVNVQNSRGESAIHLAYKLEKTNILELLLERLDSQEVVEDVFDQGNLSYLHIACAKENESLVEKLLRSSDPNVVYKGKNACRYYSLPTGSTPLHVAAYNGSFAIAEMLLQHGANLHAADRNGTTPIHSTMLNLDSVRDARNVANVLFRFFLDDPKDCVKNAIGLTYLHVASYSGNVKAVQKLLELGSDVNAFTVSEKDTCYITSLISPTDVLTCTPLHLAQADNPDDGVIDLLIFAGADVFAKSPNKYAYKEFNIPLDHKNIMHRFMSILWDREDMQKSWEEKLGLTRLHIACYLKHEESVRSVLNSGGFDINAQMHKHSKIFAGCTPLHLLLRQSPGTIFLPTDVGPMEQGQPEQVSSMVQLLLDHGANVTIVDCKNNTPLHQLHKYQLYFRDFEQCEDLLFNAHRKYDVNPSGEDGMSHFHLACYRHKADVVEKFLVKGTVDVNCATDFFAKKNAGATPLHLALNLQTNNPNWPIVSDTVDLLLQYGADVAAQDVFGDTCLHKSTPMLSPELHIFNKLTSHGADVNTKNVKGQTPFDIYSCSGRSGANDFISLFKKYNYRINNWNPTSGEGNIGKMLLSNNANNILESPEFKEILQSSDVTLVDQMGRTIIHNSVACVNGSDESERNLISALKKFIALGIDVDHQDKSGQTALHYAVRMRNNAGVAVLLKCGADVNVLDDRGMTAFSLAFEHADRKFKTIAILSLRSIPLILHVHVQKLLHLRIEVIELNKNQSESAQKIFEEVRTEGLTYFRQRMSPARHFFSQVEVSKTVEVGAASLVLFDFLSETNGIARYPYLLASNRNIIDDFFKNFNEKKFDQLSGILKLQFRKVKERLEMIDEALAALRTLLGFSIPGLCEEITMYLPNSDLKNLIASTTV